MSRQGKILLFIAGLGVLAAGLCKLLLGEGHVSVLVSISLSFLCLVTAVFFDFSFYREFLTMRTTKHGMNMGLLVLLFSMALVAANFLSIRHNAKWDLTEEGLNSISDQSLKMLAQIDEELKIHFFYRGGTRGIEGAKAQFKEMVELFRDENSKVSLEFIDSLKRPGLAQQYGIDRETAMVFVDYKGKRNSVEPLSEEGLTTAILKVTRNKNKKMVVLTGHGEKSIEESGPTGASEFSKALKASGYDVEELNLLDKGSIPTGTDAVAILGPKTSYIDSELKALRDYARSGGKIFFALDPGQRHNLALLTKSFGIEFKNDYVLDQFGQMLGASAAMALGRSYGTTDITKDFGGRMTMFHLASSIEKAPGTTFKVDELVKTGETSFSSNKIAQGRVEVQADRGGPHTLGLTSEGKLPADGKNTAVSPSSNSPTSDFGVVVFGDSDFLSNQLFFQQLNRDLALNSTAYLLKESNLISIRPKQPKGTTLTMTKTQFWLFFFGVILPVPLSLFGIGGFSWYRRRSA